MRKLTLVWALLFFCFTAQFASAQFISLDVLRRNGYGSTPLKRPKPNLLTVEAKINGRDIQLVLDTGFRQSTIRRLIVSQMGLKTTAASGKVTGVSGKSEEGLQTATVDKFSLGNVEISGVPLQISDLGMLRYDSSKGAPVGSYIPAASERAGDGFLGADFLATCSAIIDLQNLQLYLRPPNVGSRVDLSAAFRGIGMTEIPFLKSDPHRFFVEVAVNGVSGAMLLDTGDYLTTFIKSNAARLKMNGFHSRMISRDLTGATTENLRVSLQSFKIGGFVAPIDDTMLLSDLSLGGSSDVFGLLGMDVLGRNAAVIDCGQRKLYLIHAK